MDAPARRPATAEGCSNPTATVLPVDQADDHSRGWHDTAGEVILTHLAAPALGAVCVVLLATWIPHYLTWPFYSDHDVFATMAYGWSQGLLPYRDLLGNNFPGTTYLFYLLGYLFGWGRTAPFYAMDAGFLSILGLILVGWARARSGKWLPGLVAYAVYLATYLSLDYSTVAQRDWHGPFLAISGLLLLDAWGQSRASRGISALLFAAGLVFRPQIVLFLPAALAFLDRNSRSEDRPARAATRSIARWVLVFGLGSLVAFVPLVWAGVMREFLDGVRLVAYGGGYNQTGLGAIAKRMAVQFAPVGTWAFAAVLVLLTDWRRDEQRRGTVPWLVAFAGVALYKPLSPVPHVHLLLPLTMVNAVLLGLIVERVLDRRDWGGGLQLTVVLLVLATGMTLKPRFCNPKRSVQGLAQLRHGGMAVETPAGYVHHPEVPPSAPYAWDNYRELITYLRAETTTKTRVANLLRWFPAVTGPVGRLPALPAESSAWFLIVKPDDVDRFARMLADGQDDAVVVWSPGESHESDGLQAIEPTIRRHFAPETQFGEIEVWRRRDAIQEEPRS